MGYLGPASVASVTEGGDDMIMLAGAARLAVLAGCAGSVGHGGLCESASEDAAEEPGAPATYAHASILNA